MMAALALFEVILDGQGCHAAMPQEGRDCIVASCQLVSALQTVVSRNTDPLKSAVVSVTQIHAGDTWNAIPNSCVIRGTTRWFDQGVGDFTQRRITELAKSIATAFGCDQQLNYDPRFPVTANDPAAARRIRTLAASLPVDLSVVEAPPSMASEDFAFMLQSVPGCYFWLGTGRRSAHHALHSSSFDFNDEVLPLGVALWVSLVKSSLART
jgi:hippurate hydrolase